MKSAPALVGMSDGWIIPFVWTAGFTGAGLTAVLVGQIGLIITLTAAIAMWLGSYFSAKETQEDIHDERVWSLYTEIGLSKQTQQIIREEMVADEALWQKKMIDDYQLQDVAQGLSGAGWQIALTYVLSGMLTLLPYFLIRETKQAFLWSAAITAAGLFFLSVLRSRMLSLPLRMCLLRYFSLAIFAAAFSYFIGNQLT